MGADNVIRLDIARDGDVVRIAAGSDNDAAALSNGGDGRPALHLASGIEDRAVVHFRSEAARLVPQGEGAADGLILRGRIRQCSYPGGFYRYAVTVGGQEYFVDDARRFATGEAVGICLPAQALHLYPARGTEE
jgi:hypothetical protein